MVSGEEIARTLNLSRAAVCKAVKVLRQEGYGIEAVTNRGYCLSPEGDVLSAQGVKKYLKPELRVTVSPAVDSTNSALRTQAERGAPEGTVLVAGEQTQGRGRYGRTFYSPSDTGLYLSLLLRPVHASPQQTVTLTAAAAVAMCQAMEAVGGGFPQIKWVNDIFLHGKKVCGILTEAAFSLETGAPEYVVIGVGVNVYAPKEGFPPELASVAGAILDTPRDNGKNALTAAFLNRFWALYQAPEGYEQEYKRHCMVLGREVLIITAQAERPAKAVDLDGQCGLIVEYPDGTRQTLKAGEVRIREKKG